MLSCTKTKLISIPLVGKCVFNVSGRGKNTFQGSMGSINL